MLHTIHRQLPFSTWVYALLGSALTQIGFLFAVFSFFFVPFFVSKTMFTDLQLVGKEATTSGNITQIEATSSRVNKKIVYAYRYNFVVGQTTYQGTSYETSQTDLTIGSRAKIFYAPANPQISYIEDMRTSEFPKWILLFLLIFPTISFIMIFLGLRKGKKAVFLLKHGELTRGKLINSEATTTKVNNRQVYKMTFEFTTKKGVTQQMIAETHLTELLTDEEKEGILYIEDNPNLAIALDEIAGCPRIQDHRQVYSQPMGKAMVYLISPAILLIQLILLIVLSSS